MTKPVQLTNPSGRPIGTVDKRRKIRTMLDEWYSGAVDNITDQAGHMNPLEYLNSVVNDNSASTRDRVQAANDLAKLTIQLLGDEVTVTVNQLFTHNVSENDLKAMLINVQAQMSEELHDSNLVSIVPHNE